MPRTLLSLAAILLVLPSLTAEIVNKSPEELQKLATHIVVGQVTAIYERTETGDTWSTTYCIAEIKISSLEKGNGLGQDQLVYVRYWHRAWVGQGQIPPSTVGYRGLPRRGDHVRVFLARNAYDGFGQGNKDGGYNVIGPNGFEILKGKK